MKPFLKQPKSIEEFSEDITDFAISLALIKLLNDRMFFWKENRAIDYFKKHLNTTINHNIGIEELLNQFFKYTMNEEQYMAFSTLKEEIYNQMLDYFQDATVQINNQLKGQLELKKAID